MKTAYRLISIFSLLAILALTFASPAQAFDGRAEETILIPAGEVIENDVYANANEFTLDGVIKGDLVVFGTFITINGTVEGDVIAAGQMIIINGSVGDDARIAGAILHIGEKANIGGDLVSAGASLETKDGSIVGGELVVGAAQALLAGKVSGDVLAGTGALDLRGQFGGDVKAEVGDPTEEADGPPISMFFPQSAVEIPNVKPGLRVGDGAKITGDFEYTQIRDVKLPRDAVGGKVTRKTPVIENRDEVKPTPAQAAMRWTFNLLRSIATLILFGLLLVWLVPAFIQSLMEKAQHKTAASLGWGIVAYAAFFFALLVISIAMILGAMFFGVISLGGLSSTIIWVGILALLALVIAFVLATSFVTKIVVASLGGKLILSRVKPEMAESKFAPLILGVILLAALMAIPYIGWVFSALAVLIGLGAIWQWGSEIWRARNPAQ